MNSLSLLYLSFIMVSFEHSDLIQRSFPKRRCLLCSHGSTAREVKLSLYSSDRCLIPFHFRSSHSAAFFSHPISTSPLGPNPIMNIRIFDLIPFAWPYLFCILRPQKHFLLRRMLPYEPYLLAVTLILPTTSHITSYPLISSHPLQRPHEIPEPQTPKTAQRAP